MAYINGHKIIYTSYNGKQFFVDKAYETGQPVGPSWLPTNGLEDAINTWMPNRGQYYTDFAFHYSQGTNNKSYAYVRAWSASQMDVQIVLDRVFIFLEKNPKDYSSSNGFTAYTLEYDMTSNTWGYGRDSYQPNYYAVVMSTNAYPVDKYACLKTTETSVVNNSGLPFEMYV